MREIAVGLVTPDPDNIRRKVDEDTAAFAELVKSVAAKGILEPLIVRKNEKNELLLVAGHRRLAAAKKAKLATVPIEEREMTAQEAVEWQLIENLMRVDIDPMEEASGYFRLTGMGMSVKTMAERIGRSQAHMKNRMKLLELDARVVELFRAGDLSLSSALELHGVEAETLDWVLREWSHNPVMGVKRYGEMKAREELTAKLREKALPLVGDDPERIVVAYNHYNLSEDVRKWKVLEDLGLTKEQISEHRGTDDHCVIILTNAKQTLECTRNPKATQRMFGLKTTLTEQQIKDREKRRKEREDRAEVFDVANDAITRTRFPLPAAVIDEIARQRCISGAQHDDVFKQAALLLGFEKPETKKGQQPVYGWQRKNVTEYFEKGGPLEQRRVVLAMDLAEHLWRGASTLRKRLIELELMNDG